MSKGGSGQIMGSCEYESALIRTQHDVGRTWSSLLWTRSTTHPREDPSSEAQLRPNFDNLAIEAFGVKIRIRRLAG